MKRNNPNQMDMFVAMTSSPQPDSRTPVSDPSTPPEKPSAPEWLDPVPDRTEAADPEIADEDFPPSDWDQPEPEAAPPAEAQPQDTLPPADVPPDAADPFESDPFFNPAASGPAAGATPVAIPPRALPEELLLHRIVDHEAPRLTRDLDNTDAARRPPESDLAESRKQVTELQARCAMLEVERDAARAEAAKERQWRADALASGRLRQAAAPINPLSSGMTAGRRSGSGNGLPVRTVTLLVLGAIALCVMAYLAGRRQAVAVIDAEPPPAAATEGLPIAAPVPAPATSPLALAAWPAFDGKDYRITGNDNVRIVVFHYGAFSRGATLAPAAQRDLARIAAAFKPVAGSFTIEVVGHTDATPVRSTHAFSDNQELGLARAQAAAEFMTAQGGMPTDSVTTSSAGDSNPPYSGTSPDVQRKNRTVTLKITRR